MNVPKGWVLGLVGLVSCSNDVPGGKLEGTYEITERLEGACDGVLEASVPSPGERYFQLEYSPHSAEEPGRQLDYHSCTGPDSCSTTTDQARSFGPADGKWAGIYATSSTGCVLRYRLRELFPTEEGIQLIQTVYQETDESLVGDECNDLQAFDRGTRMPCTSVVETLARRL